MRLWSSTILPYLPQSQLIAQKRECDLIWKDIANGKKTNHVLINYIWDYKDYETQLSYYYTLLEREFRNRGFNFRCHERATYCIDIDVPKPFKKHHTKQYLLQNFMNLDEKFERNQKDFDRTTYLNLWNFVNDELNGLLEEIGKQTKEK